MSKEKIKLVRVALAQETYNEYQILGIRSSKSIHDVISEVLERYIDKKREKPILAQ